MGLRDDVYWEAELPEGHSEEHRLFQTSSFHNCLDRYVVTKEGRLLLVGNGWQDDEEPFTGAPGSRETVDVDFHGDMSLATREHYPSYVARFTHGTLEWIRQEKDAPRTWQNADVKRD